MLDGFVTGLDLRPRRVNTPSGVGSVIKAYINNSLSRSEEFLWTLHEICFVFKITFNLTLLAGTLSLAQSLRPGLVDIHLQRAHICLSKSSIINP